MLKMSKSRAFKLHARMQKIMLWTVRAEEAVCREDALKALRKVAKHSRKLAILQSTPYDSKEPKEDNHEF